MTPTRSSQRGSTLVVSMILLGVLMVIGVAAVSLSSRERQSADAQKRYQLLVECANAAQAKIWAEIARWGPGYLSSGRPVTSIVLPDGTKLESPAHYAAGSPPTPQIKDIVFTVPQGAGGGPVVERDCTNQACSTAAAGGTPFGVLAHCVDAAGREYEVELAFRLGI
jgi:type II secretory pathway pseudopilin PulG